VSEHTAESDVPCYCGAVMLRVQADGTAASKYATDTDGTVRLHEWVECHVTRPRRVNAR
jgi:hypothetical protein